VLFDQNQDRSKKNKTQKGFGELVITGGDTPELLDFLPKTLDQMTLFVRPPVTLALNFVCLAARYVGDSAERFKPVNKLLAVIAFVGVHNAAIGRQGAQKWRRVADIGLISRRQ